MFQCMMEKEDKNHIQREFMKVAVWLGLSRKNSWDLYNAVKGEEAVLKDFVNSGNRKMKQFDIAIDESYRDQLTHDYNRKYLIKYLRKLVQKVDNSPSTEAALLFIDLDRFKQINDTEGHQTGDDVLVGISKLLAKATRENEPVIRYGGDEFCIILEKSSEDTSFPYSAAKRIFDVITSAVFYSKRDLNKERPLSVGASIGLVEVNSAAIDNVKSKIVEDGSDINNDKIVNEFINMADNMSYCVKGNNKRGKSNGGICFMSHTYSPIYNENTSIKPPHI